MSCDEVEPTELFALGHGHNRLHALDVRPRARSKDKGDTSNSQQPLCPNSKMACVEGLMGRKGAHTEMNSGEGDGRFATRWATSSKNGNASTRKRTSDLVTLRGASKSIGVADARNGRGNLLWDVGLRSARLTDPSSTTYLGSLVDLY